ncbi:hypothetical protein CCACVL1_30544 [Corchorus capsularis]|uniref:Uncharacterized protein n=1 Tax=Corchorus capsularis TaxID=210143 RepID=A0A1R3FWP2_COCAP|nr:hypothetical protein CCACVL1_30544 [Corchorus capsularis]
MGHISGRQKTISDVASNGTFFILHHKVTWLQMEPSFFFIIR